MSDTKAKTSNYKLSDKRLINDAKSLYQNGEYEKAWNKLLDVVELTSDTTYLMLLGDIGYIYKPNYGNGGRWCYKKAAKLGCKQAEDKSHVFFRSHTLCTSLSGNTPGDSLNRLGFNTKNDINRRISFFERAVEQGSATAMVNLGRIYEQGQNGNINFEKAAQLYSQAYSLNHNPDAADHLAWLHSMGLGVPLDLKKSFELYSSIDYGRNKVNLAICYDYGIGTEPNRHLAFFKYADALCGSTEREDWLTFAAERYIDLSTNFSYNQDDLSGHIGNLYYNLYNYLERKVNTDDLSPADKNKYNSIAEQYLEDAISEGVTGGIAMNNIGNILKERKQYSEALVWYAKASKYDNSAALWNLGNCYENGIGVERDLNKAKEWYLKAKEAGNWGAKEALERLAKKGV